MPPFPARRTGKADRCPPRRAVDCGRNGPAHRHHPSRLHALSRSEWGLSPQAWLAERRIGHVRKWLTESDLPIADLALRAGYADQSALTRAMQRLTGLTPAAYRRQTRLEQKNRSPEQDSRTRP